MKRKTQKKDKQPEILELTVLEVDGFVLRGQLIDKKSSEVQDLRVEIALLQGEYTTFVETLLKRHGKASASQWKFDGKRLTYVTDNDKR